MVNVALIGCGKIAQDLHLPILAGHEEIRFTALVDRDVARARKLAQAYGIPKAYADHAEIPHGEIEAAVVATPPFHHAACTIDLLKRGVHVLVEKPMATSFADASKMVQAAKEQDRILSVGFFRRLMPSIRLLKAYVNSGWLGRPVRFEVEGGGMYSYAAATLSHMCKEHSGGGSLIDFGSHLLDLLHFVFGGTGEVLSYRDNACGGVEADCSMQLRMLHQGQPVEGTVDVTRTRKSGNFLRVHCERGSLEYQITERYRIRMQLNGLTLADPLLCKVRDGWLHASWAQEKETSWFETVRAEFDDWLEAIRAKKQPVLSGESCLPTSRVIEDCYRQPQPLDEPWVREGIPHIVTPGTNGKQKRVLLTGATGFIGSRLAEILSLRDGWQVRALVHNPGSAARLARLPVELVHGEIDATSDAASFVKDCDAVIHCAVGTEWGDRRRIFDVTVGGTRRLAEAARQAGISRFIHLSTISVHGDDGNITGLLDESSPVRPAKGSEYGESKAEAETVILQAVKQGLSAAIIRPARVYGPFSRIFIMRPMEALAEDRFRLMGDPDVPANMVYVDNLAHAILLTLAAPDATVKGETYTICDPEEMTWREFYDYFIQRLELSTPPVVPLRKGMKTGNARWGKWAFWRWPASWYRGSRAIIKSPEFKKLGRKVLQTDPIGTFPRWLLQRPGVEKTVRRIVGADESMPVYQRTDDAQKDWVEMGSAGIRIDISKANRQLGFLPVVSRERAMQLTLDWIRYAGLTKRYV